MREHLESALTTIRPGVAEEREYKAYALQKARRALLKRLALGGVGFAITLGLWHVMAKAYNLELILPSPLTILQTTITTLSLAREGWFYGPTIYQHLLASLVRALIGFGLAAAIAVPLGLTLGRFETLRQLIGPVIKAVYPIPGVAWIPLALLWFGLTDKAVVFVVFMSTFFPIYIACESGARLVDPLLIDVARCFGARGVKLFWRVILPATVPFVVSGLRIAVGTAWRMIVAAEMFATGLGIGFILVEARFLFRAADLMMAMILVSIIGYLTEKIIVGTLERHTLERWQAVRS